MGEDQIFFFNTIANFQPPERKKNSNRFYCTAYAIMSYLDHNTYTADQ